MVTSSGITQITVLRRSKRLSDGTPMSPSGPALSEHRDEETGQEM